MAHDMTDISYHKIDINCSTVAVDIIYSMNRILPLIISWISCEWPMTSWTQKIISYYHLWQNHFMIWSCISAFQMSWPMISKTISWTYEIKVHSSNIIFISFIANSTSLYDIIYNIIATFYINSKWYHMSMISRRYIS